MIIAAFLVGLYLGGGIVEGTITAFTGDTKLGIAKATLLWPVGVYRAIQIMRQ